MAEASASDWKKLAIIAGSGDLPIRIAEHCRTNAKPYFVARLASFADQRLEAHPGGEFGIGEMGARFKAMKAEGCDAIVFAGGVARPDFAKLKLDAHFAMMLPRVLAASGKGDDAILRVMVEECEKEGFRVVGADDVLGGLKAPAGALGAHQPSARDWRDIRKAAALASALGAWDVGQGAVVCEGLVLAVEALEGTDAMLSRVALLPQEVRGQAKARRGVLVKCPKPQQERRIDLPTIGLKTIENAALAGLAGIGVEAEGALIVGRSATVKRADELGMFIYGFTRDEL
jgi:UDP-2,3-diacylglucosamine hydrolase